MVDSPAYRLNHEEVIKALEEGIGFAENLNPIEAVPDARGAVASMIFRREGQEGEAGRRRRGGGGKTASRCRRGRCSSPQARLEHHLRKEAPGSFQLDSRKKFFQPHTAVRERRWDVPRRARSRRLLHFLQSGGKLVTYYGDNHPRYAGNVVKAMASAKHGFPRIVELFARELSQLDPAAQPSARPRVAGSDRPA